MTDDHPPARGRVPTRLDKICDVNPLRPRLSSLPDETPVLFVPMSAVDASSGAITSAEMRTLGEFRRKSYRTFAPGDVIFAKITPSMENGKSAIVPVGSPEICFGSTEFHVLRPRPGVSAEYIWHYVRQERFRTRAAGHMTGSVGQARVPAGYLKSLELALPEPDRQREIARTVSLHKQRCLGALERLAQAADRAENLRPYVFLLAVANSDTKGQLHVTDESATSDGERDGADRPSFPIPHGWNWAQIKDLARSISYGFTAAATADPVGPKLLRISDIQDESVNWSQVPYCDSGTTDMSRYELASGDLVFARTGATTGKSYLVRQPPPGAVFASYLIRIRLNDDVEPGFLHAFFQSALYWLQISEASVGTGQPNVNATRLSHLWVPVPPTRDDQLALADRVAEAVSSIDDVLLRVEAARVAIEKSADAAFAFLASGRADARA